jgi:molybdopterin/thiamine biosynthesis adenylyltransferase
MSAVLVIRPQLSARLIAAESRTEAFADARFGVRTTAAAIELVLPMLLSQHQELLLEVLLDLCLRMDPIVAEIRLVTEGDAGRLQDLISSAALRVPLERPVSSDASLSTIHFAIGVADGPYVDASDWCIGFSTPAPAMSRGIGAGAIFAALESAKYLFLRAVELAYQADSVLNWPRGEVFDLWKWTWFDGRSPTVGSMPKPPAVVPPLALVGCGGVGAAYLWFMRNAGLSGSLLLIDDDEIAWHNMNRLFYATLEDADARRSKAESAAEYMGGTWNVEVVPRKADHDDAIAALRRVASAGGMIASAVGEPETRKFLARRGFGRFFDAATNSDGSAQVLALVAGTTSCIDCHVRSRPVPAEPGRCGVAKTAQFAGVVPHLSAYAGALLAFEQVRWLLEPSGALGGANTQSILLPIDAVTREGTSRCAACPHA